MQARYLFQSKAGLIMMSSDKPEIFTAMAGEFWMMLNPDDFMMGKPNPNWKDSLIDLTCDSFNISYGILTKTTPEKQIEDPHAEMRAKFEADGGRTLRVEYFNKAKLKWMGLSEPRWINEYEYRLIHLPRTLLYKLYLTTDDKIGVMNDQFCPPPNDFEQALTNWQSIELK